MFTGKGVLRHLVRVAVEDRLWHVATLNVSTMRGKIRTVPELAHREDIDVLCVQETRLEGTQFESVRSAALEYGYLVHFSQPYYGAANQITGGLAIFYRIGLGLPVHLHSPGMTHVDGERDISVQLDMQGDRAFLVTNVHCRSEWSTGV